MGGNLKTIVTFATKCFVRYSCHVHYLDVRYLGGFTVEDKETVVAGDSQTDDSIRIILQNDIESRRLPPIDAFRFVGNLSK